MTKVKLEWSWSQFWAGFWRGFIFIWAVFVMLFMLASIVLDISVADLKRILAVEADLKRISKVDLELSVWTAWMLSLVFICSVIFGYAKGEEAVRKWRVWYEMGR